MGIDDRASGYSGPPRGGALLLACLAALLAALPARPAGCAPAAPRVHGRLSDGSARNVRLGYALALQMVRSDSQCSALFAPFHAVGSETLSSTFFAAPTEREMTCVCVGRVSAFTVVGGRVTKLCPEFGALDPREAALTLVHEALHSAGMPEGAVSPAALSSRQINELVAGACGVPSAARGAVRPAVRR